MNASIEYISAGIIMLMILGSTAQYTTNMVYNRMNLIEQYSGYEKASKIVDILLLSPGKPMDWGDSYEEPQAMGLATNNSIQMYQLDADKAGRLNEDSETHEGTPNYIPPTQVRDLLGLSPYFYIAVKIYPLYNITVTQITAEKFVVNVSNQWKMSVSNVNISAAYLNITIEQITLSDLMSVMDLSLTNAEYAFNMTDALGSCTLNFNGTGPHQTLLVLATQLSVKCMTTWPLLSKHLVEVDSSMGSTSGFNTESVHRNVKINGLNYVVRFTLWS